MNKKYLLIIATIFSSTLLLSFSFSRNVELIEDYAPPRSGGPAANGLGDRPGSPLSNSTCSACHSGGSFSPTISISVLDNAQNQVTSYTPGESYSILYTVTSSSGTPNGYGMQSVVLSANTGNAEAGVLSSPTTSNSQISTSGGHKYFEHLGLNPTGIFSVNWTAPSSGFGNVSLYATGIAANGNGGTSGDQATSPITFSLSESCAPNTGTDTQTACDSYLWMDGITYTSNNNTATQTLTNAGGCDSIVTLNLTINSSTSGTDTQIACDSYLWMDGNTYNSSNNTATHTLTNAAGCDSIVTLNLTINSSTSGTDTQIACDSYLWMDGNTYNSSNNTATHTITNAAGCDSIVTLNLTINSVNTTVTQVGAILTADESGATYQWLNCAGLTPIAGATNQSYTPSTTGDYAVTVEQNGCSETSSCYNFSTSTVGTFENNFGSQLIVYPNPTNGDFSIDLGESYQSVKVTLTDLSGKVIQSKTYFGSQLLDLKIEEPRGVYQLVVESGINKVVIKLIKE